jgi:hypothetical protein
MVLLRAVRGGSYLSWHKFVTVRHSLLCTGIVKCHAPMSFHVLAALHVDIRWFSFLVMCSSIFDSVVVYATGTHV